MDDKLFKTAAPALQDIQDGSAVMVGGFGAAGRPSALLSCLVEQGARDLCVITGSAGVSDEYLRALLAYGRVRRVVCTHPRRSDAHHLETLRRYRSVEFETFSPGSLARRIHAGCNDGSVASVPMGHITGFAAASSAPAGHYGSVPPLRADVALIKGDAIDGGGRLSYQLFRSDLGLLMAFAANVTIASARATIDVQSASPGAFMFSAAHVDRVVRLAKPHRL